MNKNVENEIERLEKNTAILNNSINNYKRSIFNENGIDVTLLSIILVLTPLLLLTSEPITKALYISGIVTIASVTAIIKCIYRIKFGTKKKRINKINELTTQINENELQIKELEKDLKDMKDNTNYIIEHVTKNPYAYTYAHEKNSSVNEEPKEIKTYERKKQIKLP